MPFDSTPPSYPNSMKILANTQFLSIDVFVFASNATAAAAAIVVTSTPPSHTLAVIR